jgi:hypothetical protein
MKTLSLLNLRTHLTTAAFEISPDFLALLSTNYFSDLNFEDENIDAKIYPTFVSTQSLDISGTKIDVSKCIDTGVFISLNKNTGLVTGYIDEDYLYSIATTNIIFTGNNIAITSDDGEILTIPSSNPNSYIFDNSLHDYEIDLSLPELTIEAANTVLNDFLSNTEVCNKFKAIMNQLN